MMMMKKNFLTSGLLFAIASYANAQYGRPDGSHGGYGSNPNSSGDDSGSPLSSGSAPGPIFGLTISQSTKMLAAHAALATIAFGLLLPSGGILIRVASFRGLWLVHGLFQLFAYVLYAIAFGLGIYMVTHMKMMQAAHPIIGVVCFALLFFQPFLGFIHHFAFKKHNRRTVWSYGHIWLGRIVITLGIINGGLGLQLAQKTHMDAPHQSYIIGYSVAAAIMWLLYVGAAIFGERKRKRSQAAAVGTAPPPYKREGRGDSEEGVQYT